MKNKKYKCPLCKSILVKDKWIKITGQWSNFEKERDENKKLLEKIKKEKESIEKKNKQELLKATKFAEAAGITKGIKKEKGERERMSKMLQNNTKFIIASQKRIQELEKQLKDGKTPQIAGFDYEKEVYQMLSETFPQDRIEATGKKGDVIQFIVVNNIEIGSILYECKKTEKYDNAFVREIKRHQEVARADYSVIVTHASKEGKSKFFIEENVIIIDPLGVLDLATFLRGWLINIHRMKLTKEETKEKGMKILGYMQSGEFRMNMVDTIERSRNAYKLLIKEVEDHKKAWAKRIEIYSSIHENTRKVRKSIGEIVTGGDIELEDYNFKQIEGPGTKN